MPMARCGEPLLWAWPSVEHKWRFWRRGEDLYVEVRYLFNYLGLLEGRRPIADWLDDNVGTLATWARVMMLPET